MHEAKLHNYQEFKRVLSSYQMSERAKNAIKDLPIVLLVAPSSTGRNTVIKHLVKNNDYYFIVSDTTRPPQVRDGQLEEYGSNYFFKTEEEFLKDLRNGEYLEAAIIHEQQVSGISIRELEKAKLLNKVAVTDIEVIGTDNVMRISPNARAIFLLPPSYEDWQKRLVSRGRMSPHEQRNRIRSAEEELAGALRHQYYNFVIAENVAQSASIIDAVAHGKSNPHQDRGRSLAKQQHAELQQKLQTPNH